MYQTAFLWPRSGGDEGNRSRIPVPGPSQALILNRVRLQGVLSPLRGSYPRIAGGAVAPDGTLRVAFRGVLYALTSGGSVLWARDLRDYVVVPDAYLDPDEADSDVAEDDESENDVAEDDNVLRYHSLPSMIGLGNTLITLWNTAVIFDAQGQLVARTEVSLVDDSGLAPNRNQEGIPILTTIDGEVFLWDYDGLHEIGFFGYDIMPVAIFADNSIAVSGYAGKGFCRVDQTGTLMWQTSLRDADLLPTVNQQQLSAVGSLNDRCSVIFAADGTVIETYPHPALFAEYPDGGWIAVSAEALARLSASGHIQWQHAIAMERWNRHQPLVDSQGHVYAVGNQQIVAFTGDGHEVFAINVNDAPGPLFPVQPGVFATVVGDELLFIG